MAFQFESLAVLVLRSPTAEAILAVAHEVDVAYEPGEVLRDVLGGGLGS